MATRRYFEARDVPQSASARLPSRAASDRLLDEVDIAAPGHSIAVRWDGVAGATDVEVDHALITLSPSVAEEIGPAALSQSGRAWIVQVPQHKRVRALGLSGFEDGAGNPISGSASLPANTRVSLALPAPGGGFDAPRFAVPAIPARGALPATLTGASFQAGSLRISPAVAATKLRVALVSGADPAEFSDQDCALKSVSLTTHTPAHNAQVTGPDGSVLWQSQELDPDAARVEVDARMSLKAALQQKLQRGETLEAELRVSADPPARVFVGFSGARGALLRVRPGVLRTLLEGDPQPLALAEPIAAETPSAVAGDLTLTYLGVRILPSASDVVPPSSASVSGRVVAAEPSLRALPPAALSGWELARIGVYGRAPEDCELYIDLVELRGASPGASLSPALVLPVPAEQRLKTHWAAWPEPLQVAGPAAIRVRASIGRFFWAESAAQSPIVRVAVYDPDPAGRPLHLGTNPLVQVATAYTHLPGFAFPNAPFRAQPPLMQSELFLTVDCSDLRLRYAR